MYAQGHGVPQDDARAVEWLRKAADQGNADAQFDLGVMYAQGRGARTIDPKEAGIVRRIFTEFASGKSPEAIARNLNRHGVRGPAGRLWSNTTIRGQVDRGTGILNNGLYRGVIEWNRCAYTKNPKTGKRIARPNPPERWERVKAPELRIVDDDLWFSAKTRQQSLRQAMGKALLPRNNGRANRNHLNEAHRPRFLLSGLLRCGCCTALTRLSVGTATPAPRASKREPATIP
jgi:site-specific DNA recombinase